MVDEIGCRALANLLKYSLQYLELNENISEEWRRTKMMKYLYSGSDSDILTYEIGCVGNNVVSIEYH